MPPSAPGPLTGSTAVPDTSSPKVGWLVTGGVAGLVLLLVAVFLAIGYGPRETRYTDLLTLAEAFDRQGQRFQGAYVYDHEGDTVVLIELEPGDPSDALEERFGEALRLVWEHMPGRFDLAVATTRPGDPGEPRNRYMDRAALRAEFGPRPSGLDRVPVAHDRSWPTRERPGECLRVQDSLHICNRPSVVFDSPQILTLVRRSCPSIRDLESLPETAAVAWEEDWAEEGVMRTQGAFVLGDPREPGPAVVWVHHSHEDPDAYLEVECPGEGRRVVHSRDEYERAEG